MLATPDKKMSSGSWTDDPEIRKLSGEGENGYDSSNNDKKPSFAHPTVKDVTAAWSQGTSIHGMTYCFGMDEFLLWKRFFWGIVVCVSTGLMFWQITLLFKEYLKFGTATSIEPHFPQGLTFPKVTVCNSNMFYPDAKNETGIEYPSNDKEVFSISQVGILGVESLIFQSSFDEKKLESGNWTPVVTPFGLCVAFQTDQLVYTSGLDGGLEFVADIDQGNYEDITDIAGLFVFISEPTVRVTFGSPFVMVSPGGFDFLSLSKSSIQRIEESPWSSCVGSDPTYTQETCRSNCLNSALDKECGCSYFGLPAANSPYCTTEEERTCENKHSIADAEFDACECERPPCFQVDYTVRSSRLSLSRNDVIATMVNEGLTEEEVLQNTVSVQINFESIREERVSESKVMSKTQLLSNIGGQMGVFLGVSFISLIELFGELMVFRLLPRLGGDRRLYGIGSKSD